MLYGLLRTTDYHKGIADTFSIESHDLCSTDYYTPRTTTRELQTRGENTRTHVHAACTLRSGGDLTGDLTEIYCGEGALAKKRVAMLSTEKTRAAFSALPSLGASSTALTFFPLIRPPRRAEMPYEVPISAIVEPDLTAMGGAMEPTV